MLWSTTVGGAESDFFAKEASTVENSWVAAVVAVERTLETTDGIAETIDEAERTGSINVENEPDKEGNDGRSAAKDAQDVWKDEAVSAEKRLLR